MSAGGSVMVAGGVSRLVNADAGGVDVAASAALHGNGRPSKTVDDCNPTGDAGGETGGRISGCTTGAVSVVG